MKETGRNLGILLLILTITNVLIVFAAYGIKSIIETNKYDYRDVNRDGKVSTQDVSIIKAYIQERGECNDK